MARASFATDRDKTLVRQLPTFFGIKLETNVVNTNHQQKNFMYDLLDFSISAEVPLYSINCCVSPCLFYTRRMSSTVLRWFNNGLQSKFEIHGALL